MANQYTSPWTLERAIELFKDRQQHSWAELERKYGKGISATYYRLLKRYPQLEQFRVATDPPELENKIEKVELRQANWREILQQGYMNAELNKKNSGIKNEFTIDKYKDYPYEWFPILFTADFHLGSVWTDYQEFMRVIDFILEERIKMSIVGDAIDNFVVDYLKFPMLNSALSPRQQKLALLNLFQELVQNDCLLNFVLGNHELRDEKLIGDTIFSFIDIKVPVSHNRAVITLEFEKVSYKIVEVHKAKGNSIYNKTHPNQRELRWNHPDADVIVTAHTHAPAIMRDYNYRKWQWLIKVGTYKKNDEYTYDHWDKSATIYNPILLFNTQEHKIKLLEDIDDYSKWVKK